MEYQSISQLIFHSTILKEEIVMKFESFGLNVAKERIKKNLSAYELSLRLGKDASYINKLENGKINVSLKMILAICEQLEINVVDLFKE